MRIVFYAVLLFTALSQVMFAGRYYDARTGRFLQVDPSDGNYPGISPYAYCANNPLKNIDPDGKNLIDLVTGVVVAVAGNVNPLYTPQSVSSYSGDQRDYALGRVAGDVVAGVIGVAETFAGGSGAATGIAASGTGVLAIVGAPAAVLSAAVATHGVATVAAATAHASGDLTALKSVNTNPYNGPVDKPVTVVDPNGNAIKVEKGQQIKSSPNGEYQQVQGQNGKPTGVRKDGPHGPNQKPHAHVPGVTTLTGDEHLPINTGGN